MKPWKRRNCSGFCSLPTATAGMEKHFQHRQFIMRVFDNVETVSREEDQWQIWSWKIKAAVSGMKGELAEILDAAEADGVRKPRGDPEKGRVC